MDDQALDALDAIDAGRRVGAGGVLIAGLLENILISSRCTLSPV